MIVWPQVVISWQVFSELHYINFITLPQEIASIDADTTSTAHDGTVNRQPEEAVSSTTENDYSVMSAAEGYEDGGSYAGVEGITN